MKVIIQIPCFNEEETLPVTLAALPRTIDGVDIIETLIIDDGSSDRTVDTAWENGVNHVVRFNGNRGLAAAFRAGIQASLELDADIIVNTDADNQYQGAGIVSLVRAILDQNADVAVGDRGVATHPEFSRLKRSLQRFGSWTVSRLSGIDVPDVTSGFRAYSRQAALHMNILSRYTYTHESLIQAGANNLKVVSVPISTNAKTRPSRLFRSIPSYVGRSAVTILRIYTLYRPLKAFMLLSLVPLIGAIFLAARFLWFYMTTSGMGHIQSLILSAILFNFAFVLFFLGIVGDLIQFNRKLLEEILYLSKTQSLESRTPSRNTPDPYRSSTRKS